MRQRELIAAIAAKTELPKASVRQVLRALCDEVADTVAEGDDVSLHGLGTFACVVRSPRTLRSIADHRKLLIGPRHQVRFRPSQRLKRRVAERDDPTWSSPGVQAAWRAAEVMLADLALYHGELRPTTIEDGSDDTAVIAACEEAFGPLWDQVIRRYDQRLDPDVAGRRDLLAAAARRRWAGKTK